MVERNHDFCVRGGGGGGGGPRTTAGEGTSIAAEGGSHNHQCVVLSAVVQMGFADSFKKTDPVSSKSQILNHCWASSADPELYAGCVRAAGGSLGRDRSEA